MTFMLRKRLQAWLLRTRVYIYDYIMTSGRILATNYDVLKEFSRHVSQIRKIFITWWCCTDVRRNSTKVFIKGFWNKEKTASLHSVYYHSTPDVTSINLTVNIYKVEDNSSSCLSNFLQRSYLWFSIFKEFDLGQNRDRDQVETIDN